ncbi:hypothetical protein GCM10027091_38900 [Streptomyces daliensis]
MCVGPRRASTPTPPGAPPHALTPHKVAVQMLPNPRGARGRGRYREEGGALRCSYLL